MTYNNKPISLSVQLWVICNATDIVWIWLQVSDIMPAQCCSHSPWTSNNLWHVFPVTKIKSSRRQPNYVNTLQAKASQLAKHKKRGNYTLLTTWQWYGYISIREGHEWFRAVIQSYRIHFCSKEFSREPQKS